MLALIMSGHRPRRIILREANIPTSTVDAPLIRAWVGCYKWLYNKSDLVICNSNQNKDMLIRFGVDKAKIKVIPNPTDVSMIRKMACVKCVIPDFLITHCHFLYQWAA